MGSVTVINESSAGKHGTEWINEHVPFRMLSQLSHSEKNVCDVMQTPQRKVMVKKFFYTGLYRQRNWA